MEIAFIVLWGICGITNLVCGNISRFSYGSMWVCFMLTLIVGL